MGFRRLPNPLFCSVSEHFSFQASTQSAKDPPWTIGIRLLRFELFSGLPSASTSGIWLGFVVRCCSLSASISQDSIRNVVYGASRPLWASLRNRSNPLFSCCPSASFANASRVRVFASPLLAREHAWIVPGNWEFLSNSLLFVVVRRVGLGRPLRLVCFGVVPVRQGLLCGCRYLRRLRRLCLVSAVCVVFCRFRFYLL